MQSCSVYFAVNLFHLLIMQLATALQAYVDTLNELYVFPLNEQCTKIKMEDKDGCKEPGKSECDQLMIRLREAAAKMTEWSSPCRRYITNTRNREVTLAEMAALFRLKTLVSMSGELAELILRAKSWTKGNQDLIEKFRTIDVLPMTLKMFETTCAIGEIFQLRSIDRTAVKDEFKQHLRENAANYYKGDENTLLKIGDPTIYIPPLESQVNYYRTCVHLIGTALITLIQTYMKSFSLEQIDLRTREVKEILERLPPMYMKIQVDIPLSKYTSKLLENYPPNKRQFPLAPKGEKAENAKCRSGITVQKEGKGSTEMEELLDSSKEPRPKRGSTEVMLLERGKPDPVRVEQKTQQEQRISSKVRKVNILKGER